MYLGWVFILVLIARIRGESYGSDNSDDLDLSAEPKVIEPGLTRSLHLNCSIEKPTDGSKIIYMTFSKDAGPDDAGKGGEIAGISAFENYVARVGAGLDAEVSGDLSRKTSGFLSMSWRAPTSSLQGTYVCRAVLLKEIFGTSILKAKVKVTYRVPQMSSVIRRLGLLEFSLLNRINNLEKSQYWISKPWNGRRYYLSHFLPGNNVHQFEMVCEGLGGYLFEPDSKAEWEFVQEFINTYPDPAVKGKLRVWIGATDEGHEGTWRGIYSGTRLGYIKWANRQPDNGSGKEHCAEYWQSSFSLNDMPCEHSWVGPFRFLCEVPQ